jgi:hypothetical protein
MMIIPNVIPRLVPMKPISTASLKNIDRTNMGFAPIAPMALTSIAMNPTSNVNDAPPAWVCFYA